MTAERVIRHATEWGAALTVQPVPTPLEKCEARECVRPGDWTLNYADPADALPVPVRSCGLHLAVTARRMAES